MDLGLIVQTTGDETRSTTIRGHDYVLTLVTVPLTYISISWLTMIRSLGDHLCVLCMCLSLDIKMKHFHVLPRWWAQWTWMPFRWSRLLETYTLSTWKLVHVHHFRNEPAQLHILRFQWQGNGKRKGHPEYTDTYVSHERRRRWANPHNRGQHRAPTRMPIPTITTLHRWAPSGWVNGRNP